MKHDRKGNDPKRSDKKIFNKEPLFILDVRNENDFSDWKIEGHDFDHLNVPYFDRSSWFTGKRTIR